MPKAVNKVQLANGTVLMDTSSVTVDAEHLVSGYTALDASGQLITGTAEISGGSAIVVTETPDSHGGTVMEITAVDLSQDTVAPQYLLQGYTAHNRMGRAITGTQVIQTYYTGSSAPSASLGNNGDIYLEVVS